MEPGQQGRTLEYQGLQTLCRHKHRRRLEPTQNVSQNVSQNVEDATFEIRIELKRCNSVRMHLTLPNTSLLRRVAPRDARERWYGHLR